MKPRLLAAFASAFGGVPVLLAAAPGRVNLIGEHTDYNDGFVLPMAISCGTMVAVRARPDKQVKLLALDLGSAASGFDLAEPIMPDTDQPWSNYVRGMAHGLRHYGLALPGFEMVIAGNLPKGAGLSSSASLEMASGLAMSALAGVIDPDRTLLAQLGQQAEHEFAGCQCGIMDQLVSARGQQGHALLIDCRSLEARPVRLPDDCAVMIVHSGIERGLVDGAYNERRAQCLAAAAHFGVQALRDLDEAALASGAGGLDARTLARARHVVSENGRTLAAADALETGDLAALGRLMATSHASMRDDFQITLPAIDALVAMLAESIGAEGGARMTGGGFGGAVVAVMRAQDVERVRADVLARYRDPAGQPPLIMVEAAGAGARLID